MTKLDIYGGLLGAGKTTLIKAMLPCAYRGKKTAVIENEIGRVNLDAGEFSGITVRPLTAGCVCCTSSWRPPVRQTSTPFAGSARKSMKSH